MIREKLDWALPFIKKVRSVISLRVEGMARGLRKQITMVGTHID